MDSNSNTEKICATNKVNQFVTPLVTSVVYVKDYKLKLIFSDNSQKEIDFEIYLKKSDIFKPYLDINRFKKVKLDYGDLTWAGNILDFHHSSLYNWK